MGGKPEATSSEMRYDWLADRWVIMAPNRTRRPLDFVSRTPQKIDQSSCPFCAGREQETPREVAVYPGKDRENGRWQVRVVPNKYPAVECETAEWPVSDVMVPKMSCQGIDLYHRRRLAGGHEVIIESPRHHLSLSELNEREVEIVFQAYRDRLRYWLVDQRIPYAVVFKNSGLDAGASLAHIHSQLISTDTVPADVSRINARMQSYYDSEESCIFCRTIEEELRVKARIVDQSEHFLAYCPFASRLPCSVTVLPREHHAAFEATDDRLIGELSGVVHRLVRRIELCYPDAAYNYVIHTVPTRNCGTHAFHWRIEMFPRLTKVAGFEWGSECYINPILPEDAAARLREARKVIPSPG